MIKGDADVVYVSADPIQSGVARSQVLPVVRGLAEMGWRMTLVSSETREVPWQVDSMNRDTGVNHISVPWGSPGNRGLASRIARIAASIPKGDLFHARSDPSLASVLLRHPRSPILWDVRSRWLDQKVSTGGSGTPLAQIVRRIEQVGVKRASGLMTLTELTAEDLHHEWGDLPPARLVLPTLTDCSHFAFSEAIPLETIHLTFSGSYNNFYDLPLAWRFCQAVGKRAVALTTWLRERSTPPSELDSRKFDMKHFCTYEELPTLLAESTVGLSICRLNAGPSLRAAVPTKIGEFLATGRPIVINRGLGGLDDLLKQHRVGVIIENHGDEHLGDKAHELIALLDDPDLPNRCRQLATDYFDLRAGLSKISQFYSQILAT